MTKYRRNDQRKRHQAPSPDLVESLPHNLTNNNKFSVSDSNTFSHNHFSYFMKTYVLKYLQLMKLSWQNGFVYRVSLLMWRFRQFLSSIMALTVWSVIYSAQDQVLGYNQSQMITYVFLSSFLQSFILATALNSLSGRVYSGEISGLLLKPISLFGYLAIEDIADKLRNIFFIVIESSLLFLIFLPQVPMPSGLNIVFFLLAALMGAVLNFVINLLFGTIGFWSPDTWGPKFMFFIMIEFTAGKLFPLDILPEFVERIVYFTPFPYFSFVQTQIFLGRITSEEIMKQLFVLGCWILGLYILNRWIWQRGLRDYTAAGQ